ncbi:MAG: alpha/beta hydrolase [Ktedonobacteraceae bacterium]|nr:alpha/beta hydrolase [Chloroflexota bacterium]
MTASSSSLSSNKAQGDRLPDWVRSISLQRAGIMILLLALVFTIANFLLRSTLNYPAILIDNASFATSLLPQQEVAGLAGFVGLLVCSGLLIAVSLGLAPYVDEKRRRHVIIAGGASGTLWGVSAVLGLVLVPLWINMHSASLQVFAPVIFVLTEILAPLLLVFWTLTLARQFQAHRICAALSAIGLLLVFLRSLIWAFNALAPIAAGFYGTASITNLLALLGESLWLFWLFLFGFRLLSRSEKTTAALEAQNVDGKDLEHRRVKRRGFLKFGIGLGTGIVGGAFMLARTGVTVLNEPSLESDDVPSEPSLLGTLYYLALTIYLTVQPIVTVVQQRAATLGAAPQPLPAGISLENVTAAGVSAQFIHAPGAVKSRVILDIHGGGWASPLTDQERVNAASLSQATGAWVLLPDYRLAPEHPFPAGLNDCVSVYRWLLSRGTAASQLVLYGGSAGANLVLATAVALQQSGEALPALLIGLSTPTDLAMTGESATTKASIDPVLGWGLAKNAYAAYTNNGATDPHNPQVSPLYADVHGFPPTLLQVGTQEILLSDGIRMANRLRAAGAEVKLEIWPGMFHGWQGQNLLPEARLANAHVVKFIHRHLGW